MGNRAVITFDQKPTPHSIGIYLHWNGGPESVLAFLTAADHYGVRAGDPSYEFSRVVQIIANFFGGTTSIGVGTLDSLDCDNGDNGVFVCKRGGPEPEIRHFASGDYQRPSCGVVLTNEIIRQSEGKTHEEIDAITGRTQSVVAARKKLGGERIPSHAVKKLPRKKGLIRGSDLGRHYVKKIGPDEFLIRDESFREEIWKKDPHGIVFGKGLRLSFVIVMGMTERRVPDDLRHLYPSLIAPQPPIPSR